MLREVICKCRERAFGARKRGGVRELRFHQRQAGDGGGLEAGGGDYAPQTFLFLSISL